MESKIELVVEKLDKIIDKDRILLNEEMKNHTSFKIGGACDLMIKPKSINEITNSIKIFKNENFPYIVLGKGSNILVSDSGIRGAVIKLGDDFSSIDIVEKNIISARSGISLRNLAEFCAENNLGGLEFAHGIPGSLGGATTMNAGAYGGEMKNVIKKVKVLDEDNNIMEIDNQDMEFGYRKSIIQRKNYIVLEVYFELIERAKEEIKAEMDDYMQRRMEKQPLKFPSAGSTFKRPEGYYAGKLIQDCGLKGLTYGNAMVSPKHAGFIVNTGNASQEEVLTLIKMVQKIVYDMQGVELEREVELI